MPNTLTSIFTSSPATEPVEAPHPNTGVYVTGTQATVGGPWQVVHTNVSKTATAPTMVGRLKNFPAVTASIVASGNVLNNVLATPTGSAATGTNATTINLVVSSIANQTAYRLLASDTVGGTYTQIYQGTAASFAHTGLAASQTKYYQWQYVGGGFYDDSPLSAVFSGSTTVAAGGLAPYPVPETAWRNTKTALAYNGGVIRDTQASIVSAPTDATQLQIKFTGSMAQLGSQYAGTYFGLKVNGLFQRVPFPSDGSSPVVLITLAAGSKTLELVTADAVRNGVGTGNVVGSALLEVQANSAITWVSAPTPAVRVVVVTDSIGGGNSAADPMTQGYLQLLRTQYGTNAAVTIYSFDGGSLFDIYGANANKTLTLNTIAAMCDGVENHVLFAIGTNDAGRAATDATTFGGIYAAILADTRARLPNAYLSTLTPFPVTNYEPLLETFRAQIRTAANAATYLYKKLEGPAQAASFTLVDGVHPDTATHSAIANGLKASYPLPFAATATSAPVSLFGNSEFDQALGTNAEAGWIAAIDGPAPSYFAPGGNAAANAGTVTIDATNFVAHRFAPLNGVSYTLSIKVNSISGGAAVQVIGTAGSGQINEFYSGAGTGRSTGIYSQVFTGNGLMASFIANVNGSGVGVIDYIRIVRNA